MKSITRYCFLLALTVVVILLGFAACNRDKTKQIALQGKDNHKHFSYKKAIKPKKEFVQASNNYNIPIADSVLAKYNNGKVFPVDESIKDSSLVDFLDELKLAVKEKNAMFIINHLSETIRNGWGSGIPPGINAFKETWGFSNGQFYPEFWTKMDRVLKLGGIFTPHCFENKTVFQIPYVDFNIADPFSDQVAIYDHVPVYKTKDTNSSILGYLNYDIVYIDYMESGVEPILEGTIAVAYSGLKWVKIATLNMKLEGFVDGNSLYSPLGFRFYIDKVDGSWKIIELMEGE